MSTSFYNIIGILRQDMLLRLNDMDVISNNLANINSDGFRASRSNFQELLGSLEEKNGVQISSTQIITQQGAIAYTGNDLDIAIQGEGFFSVQLPDDETAYTRDGRFSLDEERRIVTAQGHPLAWDGEIPEDVSSISVDPYGNVRGVRGTEWVEMGTIPLVRFNNPSGLKNHGNNLWLENVNSGAPQESTAGGENMGTLVSKAVEKSNVNIADELSHLISLQRGLQVSVRTFQQTDRMIQQAIQMRT